MELTLDCLPAEILSLIPKYLRCSEITCLSLVCQRFRDIYHSNTYETIEVLMSESMISYSIPKNKSKKMDLTNDYRYQTLV